MKNAHRRLFLERSAAASAAGGLASLGRVAGPVALSLSAMADAAAQSSGNDDYKALVCVFLLGAMDNGNTLIPIDSAGHAAYSAFRSGLALQVGPLAATELVPQQALPGGRRYALAAELPRLAALFNGGQAAVQLNVGPLLVPTTRADYLAKSVPLPAKLFSHNDQQSTWQSNLPEGATSGWGGRIGDLFATANAKSTFTAMSAAGNAVMVSGRNVSQYQLSGSGSVPLTAVKNATILGSVAVRNAMLELVQQTDENWLQAEYARLMARSIAADADLTAALAAVPAPPAFSGVDLAQNRLAAQLQIVSRMIGARAALGAKRQVYFVALGGWDHHDDLLTRLPELHAQVDEAIAAFHQSTVAMGIDQQVTTFTASDFGRTLASNGDGSDHGWGSHHVVVGGAVAGKRFYGSDTSWVKDGPDDVGQGRLLPSTAVDQFAQALAHWFGVSETDMATVLPGVGNFGGRSGFLG